MGWGYLNWTPWGRSSWFCQGKGKKVGILGRGHVSTSTLAIKHMTGSAMVSCSHAWSIGIWCSVLYCVKENIYLGQNVKGLGYYDAKC